MSKKIQNIIIIIATLILSTAIFFVRVSTIQYENVSNPDTRIDISCGDSTVEQHWQACRRNITQIKYRLYEPVNVSAEYTLTIRKNYGEMEDIVLVAQTSEESITSEISFCFSEKWTPMQGEQYTYLLQIKDASCPFSICASSNVQSTIVNNSTFDGTVYMNYSFEKNKRIFWVYVILLLILAPSFLMMSLLKLNFAQVVAVPIFTHVLIMYVFGLLGNVYFGIVACISISLLSLVFFVIYKIKREEPIIDVVNTQLVVWICLFLIIILYNKNMYRTESDEFSHWGLAVIDMFYSDSLSNHWGTSVSFLSYTPVITLWQYMFERLNGVFSEGILYVSFQVVILSCGYVITDFIQCTSNESKCVRIGKWISVIGVMIFAPMLQFSSVYNLIYVDPLLGIFMAYVLICYYTEEMSPFNFMRICLGLFALTLTKDMGFIMAGVAVVIMCTDAIYRKKKNCLKELFINVGTSVVVLASFISWQLYVTRNNHVVREYKAYAQSLRDAVNPAYKSIVNVTENGNGVYNSLSRSGFSITGIIGLLLGKGSIYDYEIIQNFIYEFFDGMRFRLGSIQLSVFDYCVILIVVWWLLYVLGKYRNWNEYELRLYQRYRFAMEMFLVGSVIYGGFLCLTYVFTFSNHEGKMLISYHRYMGSYVCAFVVFSIYMVVFVCSINHTEDRKHQQIIMHILVLIMTIITPIYAIINRPTCNAEIQNAIYGSDEIEQVVRNFASEYDEIYVICSDTEYGLNNRIFMNAVSPAHASHSDGYYVSTTEDVKKWAQTLNESYDYVFVWNQNDDFVNNANALVEGGADCMDNGTFYKVIRHENGYATLKPIAHVSVKGFM